MSDGKNSYDPKLLKDIISRVEAKDAELESAKGAYMKRARDIRESRMGILQEAEARGLPKKELKAVLKARKAKRALDGIRDELEPDNQDTFDLLADILGDYAGTALGAAAVEKDEKRRKEKTAERRAEREGAVDEFAEEDVRPRHLQEQDRQRQEEQRQEAEPPKKAEPAEKVEPEGMQVLRDNVRAIRPRNARRVPPANAAS